MTQPPRDPSSLRPRVGGRAVTDLRAFVSFTEAPETANGIADDIPQASTAQNDQTVDPVPSSSPDHAELAEIPRTSPVETGTYTSINQQEDQEPARPPFVGSSDDENERRVDALIDGMGNVHYPLPVVINDDEEMLDAPSNAFQNGHQALPSSSPLTFAQPSQFTRRPNRLYGENNLPDYVDDDILENPRWPEDAQRRPDFSSSPLERERARVFPRVLYPLSSPVREPQQNHQVFQNGGYGAENVLEDHQDGYLEGENLGLDVPASPPPPYEEPPPYDGPPQFFPSPSPEPNEEEEYVPLNGRPLYGSSSSGSSSSGSSSSGSSSSAAEDETEDEQELPPHHRLLTNLFGTPDMGDATNRQLVVEQFERHFHDSDSELDITEARVEDMGEEDAAYRQAAAQGTLLERTRVNVELEDAIMADPWNPPGYVIRWEGTQIRYPAGWWADPNREGWR